jgi:hypothetical protein
VEAAEQAHLEHPEYPFKPYRPDSNFSEKASGLQPKFDNWQYEVIASQCHLRHWKWVRPEETISVDSDPFDRQFFDALHRLFPDGRAEDIALHHLARSFLERYPTYSTPDDSSCTESYGLAGIKICGHNACDALSSSEELKRLDVLVNGYNAKPD